MRSYFHSAVDDLSEQFIGSLRLAEEEESTRSLPVMIGGGEAETRLLVQKYDMGQQLQEFCWVVMMATALVCPLETMILKKIRR